LHCLLDRACLATLAIAVGAEDLLLQRELGRLALVEVVQGDLELVDDVLATALALLTATATTTKGTTKGATKEVLKQVGTAAAHAALARQALLAVLVVDVALLLVREHFVRPVFFFCFFLDGPINLPLAAAASSLRGDVLELVAGVGVLVGVVLERELAVRLANFVGRGRGLDLEDVVELGFLDHSASLRATRGCYSWVRRRATGGGPSTGTIR